MKALILAAGYATRLYPLTKDFPKPLLKMGEKTIVDYIVEKLEGVDEIDEIILVTNSKFISHFKKWSCILHSNKRLSLVDDLTGSLQDRRGAVGDMHFVINKKHLKDDLIVVGGDNLFDDDLKGFLYFAKGHRRNPVIGAYDIKNKNKTQHYGVIQMDRNNKVLDFQEKPKQPKSTLVAMCLYYFPREKLKFVREYLECQVHRYDVTGLYIDWLRKKVPVFAYVFNGRWYDIGDHKFYNEAKEIFAGR